MIDANSAFAKSLLSGLSQQQKCLEPKFFYDEEGSKVFEAITELEAYYPTRTEISILSAKGPEIAAGIGPGAVLVEPGAGALLKARLLLATMDTPAAFAPGDISITHLEAAAVDLAAEFPDIPVHPFALDFDGAIDLPANIAALGPVTVFFPGSTIGNFEPDGAINLLKRFRAITNVKTLVIGADLKKDTGRLVRAYDDAQGVTAAFNMNLLTRANREVGANFDLTAFRHLALYNEALGRIEMHLESTTAQTVSLLGQDFAFRQGETIHTENSHKFTVAEFQGIAAQAGWRASDVWTDDETLFSVHLFQNSDS